MQNTLAAPVTVAIPASVAVAMGTFKRAHYAHSRIPILQNVLVTCDGMNLTLRSTNLETTAQYTIALEETCEPFATTLPLKAFADTIKGAKNIALTCHADKVTAHVDGMARVFFALPADEYPPFPPDERLYARHGHRRPL